MTHPDTGREETCVPDIPVRLRTVWLPRLPTSQEVARVISEAAP